MGTRDVDQQRCRLQVILIKGGAQISSSFLPFQHVAAVEKRRGGDPIRRLDSVVECCTRIYTIQASKDLFTIHLPGM